MMEDYNEGSSKSKAAEDSAKKNVRSLEPYDDSNSYDDDKSPMTPIHQQNMCSQVFKQQMQKFNEAVNKQKSEQEESITSMAQQIIDRERDAYYGFFKDHNKNDGNIFYNLDEIWAQKLT